MIARPAASLIVFCLFLLSQQSAVAQHVYQLVGCTATIFSTPQPSRLVDLNLQTGVASNFRNTGVQYLGGIAAHPGTSQLFGLTTFASTPANASITIDQSTGSVGTIGPTGLNLIVEGDLAFNPIDARLYGIQDAGQGGTLRRLFEINLLTGAASVVDNVPLPNSDLSAMAFYNLGRLFVVDTGSADVPTDSSLIQIDPLNASIIQSVTLSANLGTAAGLAFHPITGQGYIADGSPFGQNLLYSLDTFSGGLSPIGSTVLPEGISGLTFVAVPEPSSLALVLLGIPSLFARVCKRDSLLS